MKLTSPSFYNFLCHYVVTMQLANHGFLSDYVIQIINITLYNTYMYLNTLVILPWQPLPYFLGSSPEKS